MGITILIIMVVLLVLGFPMMIPLIAAPMTAVLAFSITYNRCFSFSR